MTDQLLSRRRDSGLLPPSYRNTPLSCPGRSAASLRRCAAEPGPSRPCARCSMGPGSAAHRRRDAALRPGHESSVFRAYCLSIVRISPPRQSLFRHPEVQGVRCECIACGASKDARPSWCSGAVALRGLRCDAIAPQRAHLRVTVMHRVCNVLAFMQTQHRLLAACFARALLVASPSSIERGRREDRVPAGHPRSTVRKRVLKKSCTAAYRWSQTSGLPCAVV